MMLGYNTNGFAHHRLHDAVEILAGLGYKCIGLTLDVHHLDPYHTTPEQVEAFRRVLEKHVLSCVIETGARFILDPYRKHSPTLISASREHRETRAEYLRRSIATAHQLGSDVVSFWSGAADDDVEPSNLMSRLVTQCKRLADEAADHNVRIAFEPEPGMFIDTMDKFAELHAKVAHPAFGLTLDVGHLQCLGELPIGDHIRRWHDWLWNIHIEDMKRGVHDHLMFGAGEINFSDVFAALREIKYKHGTYVELSRHSHNAVETARRAIAFLRDFADSG